MTMATLNTLYVAMSHLSLLHWLSHFKDGRLRLVLGSASDARKHILQQLNIPFEVRVSDFLENLDKTKPLEYPLATSWGKHKELQNRDTNFSTVLVTCDTVVISDDEIVMEKPENDSHAIEMLKALSGKTHRVVTGVVVSFMNQYLDFTVISQVKFKPLSRLEIEAYVATGEHRGKAGAYGIQGLGQLLVDSISGSYSNVVGIPLAQVADAIAKLLNDTIDK